MLTFIGEHTGKVDAKGRLTIPASFKKQMADASQDRVVIRKDIFVNCLNIYPMQEWEKEMQLLRGKINKYNKKHTHLLRQLFKGTAEAMLDGNGRILISKRLLDIIGIKKDIIVAGQDSKMELWSKEHYETIIEDSGVIQDLTEEILGGDILS